MPCRAVLCCAVPHDAARSGPLVDSGFQANLTALLVRLGSEHPHHTLYQVFSLKNGNRDKEGKLASGRQASEAFSYAGALLGGCIVPEMCLCPGPCAALCACCDLDTQLDRVWIATQVLYTTPAFPPCLAPRCPLTPLVTAVDLDKVAAAQEVLDRVAARSPACRSIVCELSELIDGYIELAAVPPPTKEAEEMAFPAALRRSRQ